MTSAISSPSSAKARLQVRGDRQVARLAVAAGQRVVGDLAQHRLDEAVLPRCGDSGSARDLEHLAAHQLGRAAARTSVSRPGRHGDQRLGREAARRAPRRRRPARAARVERVEPGGQQRRAGCRGHARARRRRRRAGRRPSTGCDDVAVDRAIAPSRRRTAGCPAPVRRSRACAAAGMPGTSPRRSVVHRRVRRAGRASAPCGCAGRSRTRARAPRARGGPRRSTKIGDVARPVEQVVEEVEQPGVGVLQRPRSASPPGSPSRQPLEEQPPAGEQLLAAQRRAGARRTPTPSSRASRGPTYCRSAASVTNVASPAASLLGGDLGGVLLGDAERCRTISASAQNATPSP